MFDTADNSLMVYIFGPEKSRPFTQMVHAFVGVGFLLTVPICNPFLPNSEGATETVCPQEPKNDTQDANETDPETWYPPLMAGISSVAWPYVIFGLWHIMTATGNDKMS